MAKVADLKNHARDLERQGQIAKALAIYRHIIKHLEGTPHILRELALYVKTGDLALKLDDLPAAIASYEQAAEHYATHGSVNSVVALCQKILRVAPERKGVHAKYARRLLDAGHIVSARDVLIEYAEGAQLNYALVTLRGLRQRSDDEAKPALEALLDAAEGGLDPEIERASKDVVPRVFSNTAEMSARTSAPRFTKRDAPQAEPPRPTPPLVQEPIGGFSDTERSSSAVDASADDDPSIPKLEPTTGPALRTPMPRKPQRAIHGRGPLAFHRDRQSESRKKRVIAAALVSVGLVGALAILGILPLPDPLRFGGGADPAQPVAAAPTPTPDQEGGAAPAAGDTALSAVSEDPRAGAVDETEDSVPTVAALRPIDTLRTVRDPGLAQAPRPDTLAGAAPGGGPPVDTAAAPVFEPADTTPAQPEETRATILAIFGLPVDSVTVYAAEGLAGYRVHQTLRTGEQVLLAVLPLGSDVTDTVGMGPVFVDPLVGDTVMGTVRVGRFRVSATGTMDTTVLDSLMRQIAERRVPGGQ